MAWNVKSVLSRGFFFLDVFVDHARDAAAAEAAGWFKFGFAFGSNLLGAMVGGFVEYLGMMTGTKALLLVILAFYLLSLVTRPRAALSW